MTKWTGSAMNKEPRAAKKREMKKGQTKTGGRERHKVKREGKARENNHLWSDNRGEHHPRTGISFE